LPISVKNLGAQFTPIPETKGEKKIEKGNEKIKKETNSTPHAMIRFVVKPRMTTKHTIDKRI